MQPWVLTILIAAAGISAGMLWQVFRRMPTKWLLDYGETEITEKLRQQQALPISPDGFLLFLLQAIFFVLSYRVMGWSVVWLLTLLAGQILILIMIADHKTRIIPDQFLIALLPLGLAFWLLDGLQGKAGYLSGLGSRLIAGLTGAFFLWFAGFLAEKILKKEAMGMGDVKLLLVTGFLVNLRHLPLLILLSFFSAAFLAVPLLLRRMRHPEADAQMAFGPFIALATLLVLGFSPYFYQLWQWYLDLLVR